MIRDTLKTELIAAMKARDPARTGAIRLIQAALKNRDIEARTGTAPADDDALVSEVLQKMVKQRRESIAMFEAGNRAELAAVEKAELGVIGSFLPAQMGTEEAEVAIRALVAEAGATTSKDMGRVMAMVKDRLAGRLDMSAASGTVKRVLSGG